MFGQRSGYCSLVNLTHKLSHQQDTFWKLKIFTGTQALGYCNTVKRSCWTHLLGWRDHLVPVTLVPVTNLQYVTEDWRPGRDSLEETGVESASLLSVLQVNAASPSPSLTPWREGSRDFYLWDTRRGSAGRRTGLDKFLLVFAPFLPLPLPLTWGIQKQHLEAQKAGWGVKEEEGKMVQDWRYLPSLFQTQEPGPRRSRQFKLGVKWTLWFRPTWTF